MKLYRFETHYGKFFILIITLVVLAVIGCEILLSFMTQKEEVSSVVRNIRLKEHKPSTVIFAIPDDKYMSKVDSLKQKKFRFETDDDGYIYPSKIHEHPDKTIIFLGGSTTECLYVDEENRFPYLVGRLLEKNGKKINSINSGVSGNHSMHSINIFLNKGLRLNPDIVVMMHNINDLNILLYENNYWNKNPSRSLIVSKQEYASAKNIIHKVIPNIYKKTQILKNKFFKQSNVQLDEFAHLRGKRLLIDKDKILGKFAKNLRVFINISKAYGVTPVLMTQANRFKDIPDRVIIDNWKLEKDFGITYKEYREIYLQMNQVIRQIGVSNSVMVIDLEKEVPQNNEYMYDPVHFNDNGSTYVAKIIANNLGKLYK